MLIFIDHSGHFIQMVLAYWVETYSWIQRPGSQGVQLEMFLLQRHTAIWCSKPQQVVHVCPNNVEETPNEAGNETQTIHWHLAEDKAHLAWGASNNPIWFRNLRDKSYSKSDSCAHEGFIASTSFLDVVY